MDAIVGQNGQPGMELKFKGPEKYETRPWKKLEIFYAQNKKTVGETEKWQDIGKIYVWIVYFFKTWKCYHRKTTLEPNQFEGEIGI